MAASVVMPALEMAQETGKIVSWLKKEGDAITKGEPLLEIETDKVVVEVEATADGVLAGVRSHEGDVVPVGVTIAWIVAPGEQPPAEAATAAPSARKVTEQPQPAAPTSAAAPPAAASAEGGPRISPKARRLAKERGVDIDRIRGTGPDGAITSEDVMAAAEAATGSGAAAAGATAAAELGAIARLMAERTTQSWTQVPHFFLVRELDAGALVAARERRAPAIERERGVKITHTDLLVALTARVLKKHPKLNASWTGNSIRLNPHVNISVAIAVTDGVVGAVIPDADRAVLGDIATLRRDLTERARSARLKPADVAGGTFTMTNLGMYDVHAFNAIIAPPQAASLAVGRIADRVVAANGQPVVRPMMTVTLSGDHRVIDGAQGAAFLKDLAAAIRAPDESLGEK
jgi:pyruvate dehydrogenase E2 component (dihydrolipoamide acetyltransferase)